jgi:hypothetical protein
MRKLPFTLQFLAVRLALAALAFLSPLAARAQTGLGEIVYTVGTVARDTHGRDWAYLVWQGADPSLISNRVFAIYAKPGDMTNNAPFTRLSVVSLQTDAAVIEPLIMRAQNIGDDTFKLQQDLLQVFANLAPATAISPAQQLSAVLRGSLGDPNSYQNILLLARNHPSIDLALGFADAELIGPGLTTFEVRIFNMKANADVAVIGRVTLDANNPTVLPAPGPPVQVPDDSPKGDLNLRFRWGTPDELRRLGLMQFGYDLYRVTPAFAQSQGWSATNPPPPAGLAGLASTNPAAVHLVNTVPITPGKLFTIPEAADLSSPNADTNTMFIMDDDGRGRPNYTDLGWTNGAKFLYYAAARDILGRDGFLSPGLLATVCDHMPPMPPRNVHVVNDYEYNPSTMTSNQSLRVNWTQSVNTNDITTNYWIYRWTSIMEMNSLSGDISNHLVAVVPHIPGATNNTYLDNGPSSPSAPADYGETYWYTVRAGDAGACGQNLSGPGGPAWGVLRNRNGPGAGSGFIDFNCLRPVVIFATNAFEAGADAVNYDVNLFCERLDNRFEWAEFYGIATYTFPAGTVPIPPLYVTNYFGRLSFLGNKLVLAQWTPSRNPTAAAVPPIVDLQIYCRAGLTDGKISAFAFADVPPPSAQQSQDVLFQASTESVRTTLSTDGEKRGDCVEHDPGGGASGTNNIIVHFLPSAGSAEYRVYRRIDNGNLSLLCEGAITNVAAFIDCFEDAPPVNGGTICFYVQFLDINGNPGPLTPLGCLDTAPSAPLPTPVLAKITPLGTTTTPTMNLSWFCAPYGVDRFELRIAGLPTPPDTNGFNLSTQLAFTSAPPVSMVISNFGTNLPLNFYSYITPKVGPGFGNNGADFAIPASVEIGKTYAVFVRALSKNGDAGEFSLAKTFLWAQTNAPSPVVPWPARPIPSTNANFTLLAFPLSTTNANGALNTSGFTGNGVLVGLGLEPETRVTKDGGPTRILGSFDPNKALLTNTFGDTIFPCALYRYQVANPNYPVVSGNVVQVSPLMENIAYQLLGTAASGTNTIILDPFINASFTQSQGVTAIWLWLKDTQPQVSGARYKYILARFKTNHEIDQLIPSNEVDVP